MPAVFPGPGMSKAQPACSPGPGNLAPVYGGGDGPRPGSWNVKKHHSHENEVTYHFLLFSSTTIEPR